MLGMCALATLQHKPIEPPWPQNAAASVPCRGMCALARFQHKLKEPPWPRNATECVPSQRFSKQPYGKQAEETPPAQVHKMRPQKTKEFNFTIKGLPSLRFLGWQLVAGMAEARSQPEQVVVHRTCSRTGSRQDPDFVQSLIRFLCIFDTISSLIFRTKFGAKN